MSRRRILVADDSSTIQKVIKIAFSRHQYDIVEAASFIEALTGQSRVASDIVIADASLPGAHGPTDFLKLTQEGRVPLLLLVGSYESVDEESFRSLGFSYFLKKPFESADIVSLVDQLIAAMPEKTGEMPHVRDGSSTLVQGSDRSRHSTVIHEGGIGLSFQDDFPGQSRTDPIGRPPLGIPTQPAQGGFVPAAPIEFEPPPPPPAGVSSFIDETKKGRKAFSGGEETGGFKLSGSGKKTPPPPPGIPDIPTEISMDLGDLGMMNKGPDMDLAPLPKTPDRSRSQDRVPAPPSMHTVRPEEYLDKIERLVEDAVDDRLPPLVRKALEDYCDRHFKTLAREVITGELRRLAEEKARHLVDN